MNSRNKLYKIIIAIFLFTSCILIMWPLPDRLNINSSLELISDEGIVLGEFREKQSGSYRNFMSLSEFPEEFLEMLLLAEDKRFYYTPGFDPIAIMRATLTNIKNKQIISGASGIAMQLIRILYSDYLPNQIWFRKPVEIYLAIKLSLFQSDKNLLEAYLNTVPMPMNRTGIPAASRLIFGRDINNITPEEMACLVVLIRQSRVSKTILERRLFTFMKSHNASKDSSLKQEYIDEIVTRVLKLHTSIVKNSKSKKNQTPHFLLFIKNKFPFLQGKIQTTIQENLHLRLNEIIQNEFALLEQRGAEDVAVVVLESLGNSNSKNLIKLRALVGSKNFYDPIKGQINGALIKRKAGSSLKPFIYALAFDKLQLRPFDTIEDSEMTIGLGNGATYRPRNYDLDFWGKMSMREALATSRNIPAVRLVHRLRVPLVYRFFKEAGFKFDQSPEHYGPGIALGSGGARLLSLTHAYSIFINQGFLHPLVFTKNKAIKNAINPSNKRLISPGAAFYISSILSDRIARRRSFGNRNFLDFPFEVAAKTGTSKDYQDSWTLGFTNKYIVGVWVGRFSGGPMNAVSGSSGAGRIFQQTMRLLHKNSRIDNSEITFLPPEDWVQIPVCSITGKKASSLCPIHSEWISPDKPLTEFCKRHRSRADLLSQFENTNGSHNLEANIKNSIDNPDKHVYRNTSETRNAKILSPVQEEVYLINPHTPRDIQGVPIEIQIPAINQADVFSYFYRINGGDWISIQNNLLITIQAKPGKHKVELRENAEILDTVFFYVKE